ncbi:ubiquitin carboxyl-terminal hydrolase 19-like [Dorcoceras hygrometricum]|uniref:Ubiquitin carboxyl-terminal hydrolase 19-like n=1 Tax=Dorcoceras hygrometricum TaxID=472368 RepID=A0A2Z7BB19_9LAMI|nr:ubiquitin carboxyl-terminal hydrolase 19-like [Dorcoceras hygrometricum]
MHVAVDLNGFLQFVVTVFLLLFGLLYLIRNTASRYFMMDSNFDSSASDYSSVSKKMAVTASGGGAGNPESCAVCGNLTKKHCARCKMVKYCSEACQRSHWNSEHKTKCKDLQTSSKANFMQSTSASSGRKASVVPLGGSFKILRQSKKILFPYDEFVELFNWNSPGYPPCGLLNCGNSCFANVVLQCLGYTRPLVAYLLGKGHRVECQRDDWCFTCELQTHVERTSRSLNPFSPINILSRLPNIGGNLGYGKQEDAHEFMRFAIDTMQSVCLDEFGGEKAIHPSYQETTLIQHIFGGRLQSQVICTKCDNVSNQFENMMDLTVEIHGDAGSLEECLDQFTAKERLHGDNMYKCDGCNDYVMAWKRLTICCAPNILTIALKRFQSGRFGKLNKRVTFPETLDLSPYMGELADGNDVYKLYAVIVHVDMLNASYFGHYVCYIKDFRGNWYLIDDCKVAKADLDEVLSQGAYMLLYSRICARPSCLLPEESLGKEGKENVKLHELDLSLSQPAECSAAELLDNPVSDNSEQLSSSSCSTSVVTKIHKESSLICDADCAREDLKSSEECFPVDMDVDINKSREVSLELNEVTFSAEHSIPPGPATTSLTDNCSSRPDVCKYTNLSPSSDVENEAWCSEKNTEGIFRMPSGISSTATNCIMENVDARGVSFKAFTNGEALVEENSSSYPTRPENGECGNVSMFLDGTPHAVKKSNGEGSGVKLKPLFAPGFLDRHPRTFGTSLSFQNGYIVNNEQMPTSAHANGKVSTKSFAPMVPENGDCGEQAAYGEGTKSNIAKEETFQI